MYFLMNFYRTMLCGYVSTVLAVVVCLSVVSSVTHQYCIKPPKCRILETIPHDSPGAVFSYANGLGKIRTVLPQQGCQMHFEAIYTFLGQ